MRHFIFFLAAKSDTQVMVQQMVKIAYFVLVSCAFARAISLTESSNKTIYLIRHGEKSVHKKTSSARGGGCLSQMGWGRAYNLVSLFAVPGGRFRTPQAVFSFAYAASSGACRDENGWFRTQQTVSAVASHLNLTVNNETGANKHLCEDEERRASEIGCNRWSAHKILEQLAKPEIDTILVAWEHRNIHFLSQALADSTHGNAFVENVVSQVSHRGAHRSLEGGTWDVYNYDSIYEFSYTCNTSSCVFRSLKNDTLQGFEWLGPSRGCGFTEQHRENRSELMVDWLPQCIDGSDCPLCPACEDPPAAYTNLPTSEISGFYNTLTRHLWTMLFISVSTICCVAYFLSWNVLLRYRNLKQMVLTEEILICSQTGDAMSGRDDYM